MRLEVDRVSMIELRQGEMYSVHIKHHDRSSVYADHSLAAADPVPVAAILELKPTTAREASAFPQVSKRPMASFFEPT